MPQTLWGRCVCAVLAGLILGSVGVVGKKAAWNGFQAARLAWEERTVRFAGAAVDRGEVAKYGERVGHAQAGPGVTVSFTRKTTMEPVMGDSAWCKTSYVTDGASMWSFTLAVEHLDTLWLGHDAPGLPGVSCNASASACGGSASIAVSVISEAQWNDIALRWDPVETLTAEQLTVWDAWAAGLPGYGEVDIVYGIIIAATVTAGGESSSQYKCVGETWINPPQPGEGAAWYGDTSWVLSGTLAVTGLNLRTQLTEAATGQYTSPRRWDDRTATLCWFTNDDPPTTTVATLGGMSVSDTVDLDPDPVTGEVDFSATAANPAVLFSTQGWHGNTGVETLNLDFCSVNDVACSSEAVSANCYGSWWSTNGTDWTIGVADPGSSLFHAFNSGNDLKLHAVGAGGVTTPSMSRQTWIRGPVRFNVLAGRGGHSTTEFPLGGDWTCNLAVGHYVDETSPQQTVWFEPGLSDWYVYSWTCDGASNYLKTGQTVFSVIGEGGCVNSDWLTDNGELCELTEIDGEAVPTIDNRGIKLTLPPLDSPLSGEYWGPVLTIPWAEQSADIPPGYASRPSSWTAGSGVTVDPAHNERWTVTGATGTLTRSLLSRYNARLGYLATGYEVGDTIYVDDWIIVALANWNLAADPAEVAAVCAVEDVTNYDNSRCLIFTFEEGYPTGLPDNWQAEATLKLTYSIYWFSDSCYYPAQYGGIDLRFGTDGFFEFEETSHTHTFAGRKLTDDNETAGLLFDLGQLPRPYGTDLRHVTGIELVLPTGEFRLLDMRLAQDPDDHGEGEDYPRFIAQPATDPWNWLQCGMGFGATFEGVPCLNIPDGTEDEMFSEDVQLGVKQTQRLQWNPLWLADQEEPPTYDPTFARNLNVRMVQILQRQEQLTGTALAAAVTPATQDDESNTLGFLYPWDLCRETSDDNTLKGAIHVSEIDVMGCAFAPITFNAVWITHGRAQGMAYQNEAFVRGDGTSSDETGDGQAAFYRQPTVGGAWEAIGSMSPDATGRWVSPPAKELGYIYGVKSTAAAGSPDSTGEFITREYQYLSAWFPSGFIPILAMTHHAVSRFVMVSDVGLASDGVPGQHNILKQLAGLEWSGRYPHTGTSYDWGNIIACRDRTEFALGDTSASYLLLGNSVTGDYGTAYPIGTGYTKPFCAESRGRFILSASKDGKAYLVRCAKGTPHDLVGTAVEIGTQDSDTGACLAAIEHYGILVAALQESGSIKLYTSTDSGDTWQLRHTVSDTSYPYLSADDRTVWLVGWQDDPLQDASGKVVALRYHIRDATLPAKDVSAVVVGPADEGRPAILRRPIGQELIAVTPKTQAWDLAGATPGIAEFRSEDDGDTWEFKEVHDMTEAV